MSGLSLCWSGLLVRSVGGERRAWKPSENASWRRVGHAGRGHPGDMYGVLAERYRPGHPDPLDFSIGGRRGGILRTAVCYPQDSIPPSVSCLGIRGIHRTPPVSWGDTLRYPLPRPPTKYLLLKKRQALHPAIDKGARCYPRAGGGGWLWLRGEVYIHSNSHWLRRASLR